MKHLLINILMLIFVLAFSFTTSFAQINLTKYAGNPVLSAGLPGQWDDLNVGSPCVILVGDTYNMWYDANWDNSGMLNNGIGHATSLDGIQWNKDTLNPVLIPGPAGSWDSYMVTQATVIINNSDSLFHMWYAGIDFFGTDLGYIGHATSPDGGHWTKDPNPVLSPGEPGTWDDYFFTGPCVILTDTTYHMWYDGWNHIGLIGIGHAISTDGITWLKELTNPVFNPGTSTNWDYPRVIGARVIHNGSMFHMYYSGGSWYSYDIGYAYSQDGINWTKYDDPTTTSALYINSDPVLTKGSANIWDDYCVSRPSVMLNTTGDSLKMWYAGADNGASTDQIGYATSLFDTTMLIISDLNEIFPNNFVLNQNYPNPFNPTTKIKYNLPYAANVKIEVFNLLGQKIETLLNKHMPAGSHEIEFTAKNLPSGVYLYRIEAGAFQQVRKMILLR